MNVIEATGAKSLPLWAWPTVLSLDAPLVAFVWQALFHRSFAVALAWQEAAALALSVWLIYLADRWLDAAELDLTKPHSFRHAFYTRHKRSVVIFWLVILSIDTALIVTTLSARQLRVGLVLGAFVLIYLLGVHALKPLARYSKEVQVGLAFGVGTSLLLWSQEASFELFVATALFAGLCTLNCLFIALWERDLDVAQGQVSLLGSSPKSAHFVPVLTGFFILLVLLSYGFQAFAFMVTLSLSALLLLTLHSFKTKLSLTALRVLADVALLTPLLFLVR